MVQSTSGALAQEVPATEVVAALGRLLDSEPFRRSPRSRDFLAYVVTETLAGRGDRLSERTVARRALGHDARFDGRDDASVRVRAPGVAVVALDAGGDEPAALFARSLSESLVQHLAQHRDIRVVGPVAARTEGRRSPAAGGVSSVLTGHVTVRDERLVLRARLVDSDSGEVVWTTEEAVDLTDLASLSVEETWAREIVSQLGDATGLVVRQEMRRVHAGGTEPELAARLAFSSYVDRGTASSISEATEAVDAALRAGPRTATLLAMRAALANAAYIYGMGDRAVELDRAESLAREALALDGSNVHAHLVLGSAARDRGHWEVAIAHAEKAVELAPHRPSYLVGAGITLSGAGEWRRGAEALREAHRLHPGLSGHTHAMLAMGHLVEGDYARALAEASLLPSEDGYVWGPLYRAMALSGLGHREEAMAEAAKVRAMRPDVLDDLAGYLGGRMRLTEKQLGRLAALL